MRLSFLLLIAIILIAVGNAIAYALGLVGMPQVLAYVAAQIFGALVLAFLLKASDPAANAYDDTQDTDMADAFTPAAETQQANHKRAMHAPVQPRAALTQEYGIIFNAAERQSGLNRVRWAEGLIRQLPADHEGRNSWLLNYGGGRDGALVPPLVASRIPNPAHGAPRPPGHRPVGMDRARDEVAETFARAVEGPRADSDPNRFGGPRFAIGSGLHSEVL